MKFNVTLALLEQMAECIHDCNFESSEEIYEYMKSCITGSDIKEINNDVIAEINNETN